jgi:glycosyltransferase involved in cell wall biosynthesis
MAIDMNLLFIAPFALSPKATVSARMLPMADALVYRGHTVTILIPPYDNPADSGRQWSDQGVHLENLSVDKGAITAVGLGKLGLQLARRALALQPDAIHVFKPVGPGALAMLLLYKRGDRNLILDNDDWEGTGGWLDINPYSPIQKAIMSWQEKWCIAHAAAVTCASDTLASRSVALGHSLETITVMPNGPAHAMREQVGAASSRRNVLRTQFGWENQHILIYAGTVPLNHDLDIAIHSVSKARRTTPAIRWAIVASGDGLPSLKTAVTQAGLDDIVEYHAFMPHDKLVERLVAADIALYPYRDTNINRAKCSGKVVDYMACGLPVVVSDVGMNATYIENGRTGLLTEPGNASAFTSALVHLLAAPDDATSMGQAGRQRIWERFGWEQRIGELESIYRSVSP